MRLSDFLRHCLPSQLVNLWDGNGFVGCRKASQWLSENADGTVRDFCVHPSMGKRLSVYVENRV